MMLVFPQLSGFCPILLLSMIQKIILKEFLNYCIYKKFMVLSASEMRLTLREENREYFYSQLDRLFPYLKDKYIQTYGMQHQINSPNNAILMKLFHQICEDKRDST